MKGVSDPGSRAESWPSQFILSLGLWGDRLGGKGPGDGRRGLGWVWGSLRPGPLRGLQPSLPPSPTPARCRMILSILTGLLFGSDGYYVALAWTSSALMYFIVSLGLAPLLLGSELGTSFPFPAQLQLSPLFQVRSLRTAALGPDSMGARPPGNVSSST